MPTHDWRDDDHDMVRDRYAGSDHDRYNEDHFDRDDGSRGGGMFRGSGDDRERSRERGGRDRWRGLERDMEPQREARFGPDDFNHGIPMDKTEQLIASNKVEGTTVYGRDGDRLGTIHNFMVDKVRGQVRYAVLKHTSGFLGLGERYFPLEWDELTYDTRKQGYCVGLSEDDLDDRKGFDAEGRTLGRSRRQRGNRERHRERGGRGGGW